MTLALPAWPPPAEHASWHQKTEQLGRAPCCRGWQGHRWQAVTDGLQPGPARARGGQAPAAAAHAGLTWKSPQRPLSLDPRPGPSCCRHPIPDGLRGTQLCRPQHPLPGRPYPGLLWASLLLRCHCPAHMYPPWVPLPQCTHHRASPSSSPTATPFLLWSLASDLPQIDPEKIPFSIPGRTKPRPFLGPTPASPTHLLIRTGLLPLPRQAKHPTTGSLYLPVKCPPPSPGARAPVCQVFLVQTTLAEVASYPVP